MHRALVAHGVEWIAVFGDAAASADDAAPAAQAPRMQQTEVVPYLVRDHRGCERSGAVDPRFVRITDIREAQPSAGGHCREHIDDEVVGGRIVRAAERDRKSTRLNSSH